MSCYAGIIIRNCVILEMLNINVNFFLCRDIIIEITAGVYLVDL